MAKPLLAQLPEGVYRELLTTELARRVGLPRERLDALLGNQASTAVSAGGPRAATGRPVPRRRPVAASRPGATRGSLSRQAIALLPNPAVAHGGRCQITAPSGQRGGEMLRVHNWRAAGRISRPVLRALREAELPHCPALTDERW